MWWEVASGSCPSVRQRCVIRRGFYRQYRMFGAMLTYWEGGGCALLMVKMSSQWFWILAAGWSCFVLLFYGAAEMFSSPP